VPVPELSPIRGVFITGSARNADIPPAIAWRTRIYPRWVTALAVSAPVLAEAPIALHSEVAQTQIPAYPPTAPGLVARAPLPGPQAEIPPPARSPGYDWEHGHWSWNGMQYLWQPGRYVDRPAAFATYMPGHWEQ